MSATFQAPRTVAELRRLPPGTRMRITMRLTGKCDVPLTLVRVGSKDLIVQRDGEASHSYLTIPKASEFLPNEHGFAVMGDNGPRVIVNWEVRP